MTNILSAELSTGTITVEVERSAVPPDELFGFAERHNPKRSFLFVSKVLGRHVPATPAAMNAGYRALASALPPDLPGPVLVTGMAETAIGIGAGVHRELAAGRDDVVYLCTTRHRMAAPVLCEFLEEHSHATDQTVHWPVDPATRALVRDARTLVMVDDEASTGKTFANLHRALVAAGLGHIEKVFLVTLTDWSGGRAAEAIGPGTESVALLSGRYSWTPRPGAEPPRMRPVPAPRALPPQAPRQDLDWGRLGVTRHEGYLDAGDIRGERVLVVGTGEHVWQPFLLAERLERAGNEVRVSAVTRSPIADGHAIASGIAFSDNYGIGVTNFLYNVDPAAYDRIVLCIETGEGTVDPVLLGWLGRTRLHLLSDLDVAGTSALSA